MLFESPKHEMTEQERLMLALTQVNNVAELTKNNEWKTYIYGHLSTVKCELERQLSLLDAKQKD
jgi:hypothetical protein